MSHKLLPAAARDPLVSIVITHYNQEFFIREAVRSAVEQDYPKTEIIVVDDGSTKPVAPLLAGFEGLRVQRIPNGGCSAARNHGFEHSSGDFLIFLDGDDELLPDAVTNHLKAFRKRPNAALSFGATRDISEQGKYLSTARLCKPRRNYFLMMLECNPIASPGTTMIRRQSFIDAGKFDPNFSGAADLDLYLRMLRNASAVRQHNVVLRYRRHSANMSDRCAEMLEDVRRALEKVELIQDLTKAERRHLKTGWKRWEHFYHPRNTFGYLMRGTYFRFGAMLNMFFGI